MILAERDAMNTRLVLPCLSTLVLLSVLSPLAIAGGHKAGSVDRTLTNDRYRAFLANKVFNFYGNNGDGAFNLYRSDDEGFEFPSGSGNTMMFEDGIVWGGYSKGSSKPLVGGSTYRHGVQAGKIKIPGTATTSPVADDPTLAGYRIYSVRRQITPATPFDNATVQALLAADAPLLSRYTSVTMQDLYNQYVADWTNWPAADGAPYQDVNGNGKYDPSTDIPGVQGADQTLWYVANDLDPIRTAAFTGSPPIGIEMQRTIYGYNASGPLSSCIICMTRLINKSGATIDSMYIAQWGDPDVGSGLDDFVGCDTLQNLGFAYNGRPSDGVYGTAVPAIGQVLLQGPVVPGSPNDTARFGGRLRPGFKNLPMSAFVFFVNGDTITYTDPTLGPNGDVMWYHLMKGTISKSGAPFVDPTSGKPTKFCFPGDPATGTGWTDGGAFAPGDRRMALITGPLTMANGDTQEIVVGTFAAQGADRLSSVGLLRSYAPQIRKLALDAVIAGIAQVDSLYPTHSAITLEGSATTLGPSTPSLQWFLAARPPASKAGLVVTDSRHASITPDTPGVYRVGLVATIAGAGPDTALVDLHVTSVQRPVAACSVNGVVTLGDTVLLDGSASHDPNGFPMTLTWHVTGSLGFGANTPRDTLSGFFSSQTGVKVWFVPLRTALHTVSVDVNNGYFTSTSTRTFQVKPLASSNVTLRGQLASNTWQLNYMNAPGFGYSGFYGWGGFKEIDGTIWADDGGLCGALNFKNYSLTYQIFNMEGFSFDGGGNYLVTTLGSVVYALQTNGYGGVLSSGNIVPFAHPNADSLVQSLVFKKPYVFLPCRNAGILVYDITYPASPVKVSQYMNGEYWSSAVIDGNLLFGAHPATKRVSVIDISKPATIAPVALVQMDRAYGSITKVGRYFFLVKANTSADPLTANTDTIAIYDFTDSHAPVLKSYIGVPKTFNPYNRFNAVAGFDSVVITSTAEGVYLFDVGNPVAPMEAGHFLTGSYFSSVFMNASHMLAVNYNRAASYYSDPYEYEGMLELQSPYTGVSADRVGGIPTSTYLYQNYPNPFNPTTTIKFQLPGTTHVTLTMFDVLGRQVSVLVNDRRESGVYEVKVDGSNLASGVYFYRLQAGSYVLTKRLLLLK